MTRCGHVVLRTTAKKSATGELFMIDHTLYETIRRYAARLLKDGERAQDVVQEVFLRKTAYKGEILNERAWLYRTARNLVIDIFRKDGRIRTETCTDSLPDEASRFSPQQLAEKKEELDMLQEKLNELPPRNREVLRLKFQEGLKYAEIAEIMNESVTTIAWLIHDSIKKLRTEMVGTT